MKNGGKVYPEVTPAVLPSSLSMVFPNALVYSTSPPALVCGTVTWFSRSRGFSWQKKSPESLRQSQSILHNCSRTLTDLPIKA